MLTDDDKKWIAAQISGSEQRMVTRIDAGEERMVTRIDATVAASEERMGARMEKIETALLTEFHKWASPVVTRLRSHSDAMRTMDLELEALQGRVDKLEGK